MLKAIIRVCVYCDEGDVREYESAVLVWKGDLPFKPAKGDVLWLYPIPEVGVQDLGGWNIEDSKYSLPEAAWLVDVGLDDVTPRGEENAGGFREAMGHYLAAGFRVEWYDGPHEHWVGKGDQQAALSLPIADLNLHVRARKCMYRLGIETVGQLIDRRADELTESKNFGRETLQHVKDKLAAFGLKLREE